MTDTSEQIKKIQKLVSTCTNPKLKKTYQDLLVKLQEKLKSETPKQQELQVQAVKPERKTEAKTEKKTTKKTELKPQALVESLASEPTSENPEQGEEKPQGQTKKKTKLKPEAPVEQKSSKSISENEGKEQEKVESEEQEKVESEEQEKAEAKDEEKDESEKGPRPIFQGIGILKGEVTVTEEKSTIKLDGKEYRLYYIPGRRAKAYEALKREIELTGNSTQRLIVYPKVLHLPKREQPHVVAFQLVGFIGSNSKSTPLNQELRDGEFKLSGLWQFIPVCRTPCISIFRNFDKERLAWIKETEPTRTVKFMKASHVPLLWKDSPNRPFRFNPKADKEEQGKPKFVQVKVKFIPSRDVFGFVEELAEVRDKAPGFLKASKKLKAEAMAAAKQQKQGTRSPDLKSGACESPRAAGTSEHSKSPKEKHKNQSSQSEVVKQKEENQSSELEVSKQEKQETSEQLQVPKEQKESQSSELEVSKQEKQETSEQLQVVKEKEESQSEASEVVKEQKESQSEASEAPLQQKESQSESPKVPKKKIVKKKTSSS